jgi:hypothetical protein
MNIYSPNTNNSVYTYPTFNSSYLTSGESWALYIVFQLHTLTNISYKALIGSTTYNGDQSSFFGLWISPTPNNIVYIRNGISDSGNATTLQVKKINTWYELIVKYHKVTQAQLLFSLREVYSPVDTLQSQAIGLTNNFAISGTLSTFTSGGWLVHSLNEKFPGQVETVKIGTYITNKVLSDLFGSSTYNVVRGTGVPFLTSSILSMSGNRSISCTTYNPETVSVTGSSDSWTLNPLLVGNTTLVCTVTDIQGFYPTVTSTISLVVSRTVSTITVSGKIIRKYVLNGTISFGDIITTNNTDAVTRTFVSANSLIATIPNASSATATIVGAGTATINVSQNETANFTSYPASGIIIIVTIGQGVAYDSLNLTYLDLIEANLSSSIFTNCDMTFANMFGAVVNSSTDIRGATLTSLKSGRINGFTTLLPTGYKMI